MKTSLLAILGFLHVLQSASSADISMQDDFGAIAVKSQVRLFIQTTMTKPKTSNSFESFYRIEMLARMLNENNAPPDLAKAISAALPNATVSALPNKSILIIDKDLKTALATEYKKTSVKIDHFSGSLSDLLAIVKLPSGKLILDQTFSDFDGEVARKMNFAIKDFSFEGSIEDMLNQIATQNGTSTSYIVTILKENSYVRFFAFTSVDSGK